MKNAKRIISMLCVLIMVISAMSGCGKKTSTSDVQIVEVWTESTHTKELVTGMVDEWNKTEGVNRGIQIDYKVYGADYKQVVDLAYAGGKMPDLFRLQEDKKNYTAKNGIVAIDDINGGKEFLEKYKGNLERDKNIVDGKTYSVPFNVDLIGLVYNKDLFKKHGIVDEKGEALPPKTWNDVREYSKKMTVPAEKTYGIALPLKWGGFADWCFMRPAVSSCGYSGYDYKTGKFNFDSIEPLFQFMSDIKNDNTVFPGAEGLDNDPARAQFAAGRVGMMLGALWDVGVYNDQFEAKCDWGVAEIPVINENDKHNQWMGVEELLVISSSAKEKNLDKVFEVYKWFNSDEFLTRMYEEGKYMPYNADIIKNAGKEPAKKGWSDFGKLVKVSSSIPTAPASSVQGYSYADIINLVWAGNITPKDAVADLTKRYNEDLEKNIGAKKVDNAIYKDEKFNNKRK